ncbi:THO complex subunit 1 [Agrilus planipennis]|uniref:THO complex subunit 1 n=1 Tax=Agrilus planipennis TaxID=224129 RepID=A0A1W4WQ11_AGRPL|nr:THO complex subunit 1 [Agrilus planipennis]
MAINYDILKQEYKELLSTVLQTNSIDILEQKNKTLQRNDLDLKSPLDQAFRDYALELLTEDGNVQVLQNLIVLCIASCRKGMTTPTIPVVLLGDIFDAVTLNVCEELFSFVESNVSVWKEELFFISCKNNLLRMCNDLLRRLSRSSATVFCGRILLFLAKFFPFSERSGLNIVSEFNLENITEYGADTTEETPTTDSESKKNIVIDYSLYCKFWSLQDFFRNPNQCYNKVQWKVFTSHTTNILNTFQGLKLDYVSKNIDWTDKNNESTPYFSKYLTNQKLLDLQIYDVNFRRFVLLQFLILFQYLTSNVKFKTDSFELKADQKEWIQNIIEKVYSLLRETPPDGTKFAEIVKNILHREEHWNTWKNDGCPEFKKGLQANQELTAEKRRTIIERPKLGDIIRDANNDGKYYLGTPELTKLWNLCPDNLEACKGKDRDFLPSLETYFSDAIDQLESPTPIKDEDKLLKDGNFGWRALRLLARRSPHFFTYTNNPMNQLPDYLEMMVRKIATERPGRVQEHSEQMDTEMEEVLFKAGEEENTNVEMRHEDSEFQDDHNIHPPITSVTSLQLDLFSRLISPNWKKLAAKLGYNADEIKFFEDENPTPEAQAKNMLHLWFEENQDDTLDNLAYILEGLGMTEAAEAVKSEIGSNES